MKGKVLLVIALYTALGVIGFVNFGLQDYVYEFVGWKTPTHETFKQRITKEMNIQPQPVSQRELQEPSSEQKESD